MELEEYRKKYLLSYEKLAFKIGMTQNKTYRICQDTLCIKLNDAYLITNKTKGEVTLADLAPEDCG